MPAPVAIGKELPKHELYDEQCQARRFWRISDRARWDYADGVDAAGKAILPQHESEPPDRYTRRRSAAISRAYVRSILDRYSDHQHRQQAKRPAASKGGQYETVLANADGQGMPLADLLAASSRRAQTDGLAYLLCDASTAKPAKTAAEERETGRRYLVRQINPDAVLWWREYHGQLAEALVLMEDAEGMPFGWLVGAKTTQRITLRKEGADIHACWVVAGIDEPQEHSYGACPLVRLSPQLGILESPGETSQGAPIAECQKRLCNFESWLWVETFYATMTTPIFLGVDPESLKPVADSTGKSPALAVGPGQALCLPAVNGTLPALDKLGADPAQAESLRKTIADERAELYRVAGISAGNPTEVGQPESGVAKAFAFNEVQSRLTALAKAEEQAENAIVRCLSAAGGWAYPGDASHPREFDLPDLAVDLQTTIGALTSRLPMTIKRHMVHRLGTSVLKLPEAERASLAEDLRKMSDQASEDEATQRASPFGRT